MEETLKRLLEVETQAEQLVSQATQAREQQIKQALEAAHQTERDFEAKQPTLHAHFIEQANIKAQQSIAELQKRYENKKDHLRSLAEQNQQNALESAVALLMQVGKSQ